jgi:hypothetical protein
MNIIASVIWLANFCAGNKVKYLTGACGRKFVQQYNGRCIQALNQHLLLLLLLFQPSQLSPRVVW